MPNKLKLLIENLREAASYNNLSTQFSSIEKLNDSTCFNITGIFFPLLIEMLKIVDNFFLGFKKDELTDLSSQIH